MATISYVGKTSTGKLHRAMGQSAAVCSSGHRGLYMTVASTRTIKNAPDSAFCKKCFPKGRDCDFIREHSTGENH